MDEIIRLIQSEMKPSLGCTEPVAVGLAVSNTSCYLEQEATHLHLRVSSNIFKNAYCVKIPKTTKAGIPLAVALGYLLRKKGNTMEIFSGVTDELVCEAEKLIAAGFIDLEVMPDKRFYIEVTAENATETVTTLTLDSHDNLVQVIKDGVTLLDKTSSDGTQEEDAFDVTTLDLAKIVNICETIPLEKILFLREGVAMNMAASKEGLANAYGLEVGKTIQTMIEKGVMPRDLQNFVKMTVSAASDCRMGGGDRSAMTVLGSGNQGFEAILPVAAAAQFLNLPEEKMLRAEMISILTTIFIKYQVGRLSPICGATLSGAASSCAIVWLMGGNLAQMAGAIQNMMGNIAGMICDGAKDGCALKLANCSGEAVLSALLSLNSSVIQSTDGIISRQVEETVKNIARLSGEGMADVDMNIISIMMDKTPT